MKKHFLSLLVTIMLPFFVAAQIKISGEIKDRTTGDPLNGANIVLGKNLRFTVSDENGKFSIVRVSEGTYSIKASFVGYKTLVKSIEITKDQVILLEMESATLLQDEVIIESTRAPYNSPSPKSRLSKKEIEQANIGKDLPYLLESTPSLVVSSDAGAGVGYTGMWIRGTDMSRINVMINGIPLNDPESHLVYWVDLPDIASSSESIHIQRGVGTSVNGAGAFGGSINVQTTRISDQSFSEVHSSVGSFNTFKNTVAIGSGLLGSKYAFEGRLSKITSDGYIDRATSNLGSYYLTGGYYGKNNIFRVNVFGGKEITYQAWEGLPSELLNTNRKFNFAGMHTNQNGDTLFYSNQVDDYRQDHVQVFYSHEAAEGLMLNVAGHYTRGFGFYESFKEDQKFSKYGLPKFIQGGDTLSKTDLVRRKYLDNYFYGITYSAVYNKEDNFWASIGGAYNVYEGDHYGRIIWAEYSKNINPESDYYFNSGLKKDFNIYLKSIYHFNNRMEIFGDIQYRNIYYNMNGIHDDLENIDQTHNFNFINPKAGITYHIRKNQRAYISLSVANREPSRNNFRDADADYLPKPERLLDYEVGYELKSKTYQAGINFYFMDYTDQLVLTGKINNVGSPIMVNVPNSYRAGAEFSGSVRLHKMINISANATFSSNKISEFTEYIDNWDTWGQESRILKKTDISFSPSVIAGAQLMFKPVHTLQMTLSAKHVGKQFIDNTSNASKMLEAYTIMNFRTDFNFRIPFVKQASLFIAVNNVLNHEYESNAWVYSYLSDGKEYKMDGYYPQAGIHFMTGLQLKF